MPHVQIWRQVVQELLLRHRADANIVEHVDQDVNFHQDIDQLIDLDKNLDLHIDQYENIDEHIYVNNHLNVYQHFDRSK